MRNPNGNFVDEPHHSSLHDDHVQNAAPNEEDENEMEEMTQIQEETNVIYNDHSYGNIINTSGPYREANLSGGSFPVESTNAPSSTSGAYEPQHCESMRVLHQQQQNMREQFRQEMRQRHQALVEQESKYGKVELDSSGYFYYRRCDTKRKIMKQKLRLTQQREKAQIVGDRYGAQELTSQIQHIEEQLPMFDYEVSKHRLQQRLRLQESQQSKFGSDLPIVGQKYILQQLLGIGGMAEVWKSWDFEHQRFVALKISRNVEFTCKEHHLQKHLCHPNIVPVVENAILFDFQGKSYAAYGMDIQDSDLEKLLKEHKTVNEMDARQIMYQLVQAVQYLHVEKHLAHFDLKPANCLVSRTTGEVKLTDFHLAKRVSDELQYRVEGTYSYLPPEYHHPNLSGNNSQGSPNVTTSRHANYGDCDIWALGIIFYMILYGRHPIAPGVKDVESMKHILYNYNGKLYFPPRPEISVNAKDIIRSCLNPNFEHRPSTSDILAHGYFANMSS